MRSKVNLARKKVAALRDALLSPTPESIEACLPGLTDAIGLLESEPGHCWRGFQPASSPASDGGVNDLHALKRELGAVQNLIQHGEKLNRGLARMLGEQIDSYTPCGASAPIAPRASISIEG